MTLAAFVAIYFVHLAAAMSPGPAVLLGVRTSLREGFVRGTWLAVGIGLGACVWAAAAMFGLAILFKIAPALLTTLKFAGAAYLLYLAFKMWRHAAEPMTTELDEVVSARSNLGLVWQGIATQLANPKPAVFFGTIFLTFIPPHAPVWAYAVILGIVFFNDAGWNVVMARIFSLARSRAIYIGLKTHIDRVFGGLLGLLGLKLALT
ncbi:threonine/homoserine/homoserine lactone efflux protein [Rhodobacter aestuarii]|uniref:Threonine/homoserine/homoserine lactone efflux protein n=1 Tax=Rhodobacter aestuarii TaxID=453582 RepID=A0A1N7NP32_9RHOB|nr:MULTISPECIES: LysE family translocator [Rhodobacter]PTV94642.1 threonine/homoserine/homoserine lactone efflux protein [Rhodobacter aestuarii]SIT00163.1 Threonine/homoserine/homoserine lactone efflux protein [Rhodobacter aestuarii]SOC12953.1 threonine/homoserine/homoserine lactone efflux protein [Rhodobacter sp. JA431]